MIFFSFLFCKKEVTRRRRRAPILSTIEQHNTQRNKNELTQKKKNKETQPRDHKYVVKIE